MSEGVIVSALVLAVLLGVGSAAFLVMRSPAFWGDVVREIAAKAWPQIKEVIAKRNDPETERRMHECLRSGGTWDNFRKKCRNR